MAYIDIPNKIIEEKIEQAVAKQLDENGLLRFIKHTIKNEIKKETVAKNMTIHKILGSINSIKIRLDKIEN